MDKKASTIMSPEFLTYAKALFAEVTKSDHGLDDFCHAQHIARAEYDSLHPDTNALSFDRFVQYLLSPKSDAMGPAFTDGSYPLSDYYVSTSHNTYLWGNQLYGKASADAYRNVLERGCRSVEIDVWDPSDDSDSDSSSDSDSDEDVGKEAEQSRVSKLSRKFRKEVSLLKTKAKSSSERSTEAHPHNKIAADHQVKKIRSSKCEPRVLHGHTATKEVPFRTVCEVIGQHAFQKSDLPVVVSLEVHTSPPQQKIMVDIMKELWSPYLDLDIEVNDETPLPLLDTLRRRILVKVKYTAPENVANKKETAKGTNMDGESSDEEEQEEAMRKGHIIPELGCMGVYTRSYHFKSFDQPEAKLPTHIFSLSEKKLLSTHQREGSALFQHNKKYLMRAYPKGLRINSTNLDPAPFWRQGVQMVALNWQYCNAAVMLNQAMFEGTGGWALKPEGYLSQHHATSLETALTRGTLDLSIEFLAGQSVGPVGKHLKLYVKCELHIEDSEDADLSEAAQSREGQIKTRTEAIRGDNNPDFLRQVLRFQSIPDVAEELTFIRFKVMDDETLSRDEMVAWACFRLDRFQPGIRLIHLYDPEGQPTNGVLLVRISKSVRTVS